MQLDCKFWTAVFLPVTFVICRVASPELPTESTALHTIASMQDKGVDLTLNVNTPVTFWLVNLKAIRFELRSVQYPVQLYDTEKGVATSHLNIIHIAAGYGGVSGSVVMFTCKTTKLKTPSLQSNN